MPRVEIPTVGVVEFPDTMTATEIEQAIRFDILKEPREPGTVANVAAAAADQARGAVSAVGETLRRLPAIVTEGIPAAARAFERVMAAPTAGQNLMRDPSGGPAFGGTLNPSLSERAAVAARNLIRSTPIPAAVDLTERALRVPAAIGAATAELGPEKAKPLTEALATGAVNLATIDPRAAAGAVASDVRNLVQRPAAAPKPQLALPPAPYPMGPVPEPPSAISVANELDHLRFLARPQTSTREASARPSAVESPRPIGRPAPEVPEPTVILEQPLRHPPTPGETRYGFTDPTSGAPVRPRTSDRFKNVETVYGERPPRRPTTAQRLGQPPEDVAPLVAADEWARLSDAERDGASQVVSALSEPPGAGGILRGIAPPIPIPGPAEGEEDTPEGRVQRIAQGLGLSVPFVSLLAARFRIAGSLKARAGERFNLPAAAEVSQAEIAATAETAERVIRDGFRTGEIPSLAASGRRIAYPEMAPVYARAAVGAVLGGSLGDSPEERVRNALVGAGLGAVASRQTSRAVLAALKDEAGAIGPSDSLGRRIREQVRKGKSVDEAAADVGLIPAVPVSPKAAPRASAPVSREPLLTAEAALRIEQEVGPHVAANLQGARLSTETTRKVVTAAERAMTAAGVARDPDVPITLQVTRFMAERPDFYRTLRDTLRAEGTSEDDFAQMFMATASSAGRQLQQLSDLQRVIAQSPQLRELAGALGRATPPMDGWEIAGNWWSRFVNLWRGSLVTALSTTVRNIETQAVRFPLATVEKAVDGTLRSMFRLGPESERGLSPALRYVMETAHSLPADKRQQVVNMLAEFPAESDRLFYRWASDVERQSRGLARPADGRFVGTVERTLSGAESAIHAVNVLNRGQEEVTRKVAFRVKLAEVLERRGVDIDRIGPKELRVEEVATAVDHALEMTYATSPKSGPAKWVLDLYANPLGKTLAFVAPFPRFMFNAWKYLFDYSPAGFVKLLSGEERARIAAGDTGTLSKAIIGTGLFLAAKEMRDSEYAGERWYELKTGSGRVVDMRPFAPFSHYLFMAEVYNRVARGEVDKTSAKEIVSGVLPSFRAGAGMYALDSITDSATAILSGGDVERVSRHLRAFAGEVAGGFAQPLTTIRELYADYGRFLTENAAEEAKVRDTRSEPFLGPIKRRIPGVSQTLPERELPLRAENPELESVSVFGVPLSRQITGLSIATRTAVETEVARLKLTKREIEGAPTGEPDADRLILKHMGPIAASRLPAFLDSPAYARMDDTERRARVSLMLEGIRQAARARAAREAPQLFGTIGERQQIPARVRDMMERQGRPLPSSRLPVGAER